MLSFSDQQYTRCWSLHNTAGSASSSRQPRTRFSTLHSDCQKLMIYRNIKQEVKVI